MIDKEKGSQLQRSKAHAVVYEYIKTIFFALLIALFIRTFLIEPYKIPSGSMRTTLQEGDRLFVLKCRYNLSIRLFGLNKILLEWAEPKRGDVVVFKFPLSPNRNFIKRVIGLPGEEIYLKDNQVYINGKLLMENYKRVERSSPYYKKDYGPVKVPPSHYFMLGDNRDHSDDSRNWGFLKKELIVGKAWLLFWPPHRIGLIN